MNQLETTMEHNSGEIEVTKSIFDVANFIITLNGKKSHLDLLKLIKMSYLCYGWYLSYYNKRLFCEKIKAWVYGPVILELYLSLKHFRGADLPLVCLSGLARESLNEQEKTMIEEVYKGYKDLSGVQLSSLTHKKNSPWDKTYNGKQSAQIKDALIKKHFDSIRKNG